MATGGINHIDKQMEQKLPKNLTDESDKHQIRLILLGKAGHGKSSTGSSMLKQKLFSVSSSTSSHTKHCRVGYRSFEGIDLMLCDTQGLFDTESDPSVVKGEIKRAVDMVHPGQHAFLIHFKIGNRFTDEEQETIEQIQDIFGQDASKYCILILTGEDNLIYNDETIEGYLETAAAGLKRLLAQCQNRYIAFNNRAQQGEIDDKIRQLLKIIQNMLADNQTAYYSKEQLERAAQLLQEREQAALEAKLIETEKLRQSLYEEVSRDFALREKAIEEERQKLNEMATKLTRQNHDEITQQGPTALERVCSALPPVADALTRIATAYFKQKQHPQNNEHQNFYSKTDLFRQSSDDFSLEEEEGPFGISINPRSFRTSSGEFQMHSDSD